MTCYKKTVIAADEFRRALGHFATGVTTVTTLDADGRPTGLTASAFTSVSLDPPLILVCVDHKSQSYPPLLERRRFGVNVLGLEQEAISKRFASTRLDKFDGVPHHVGELGVPLIDGALAHLECVTVSTHVEGAEDQPEPGRRRAREDGVPGARVRRQLGLERSALGAEDVVAGIDRGQHRLLDLVVDRGARERDGRHEFAPDRRS